MTSVENSNPGDAFKISRERLGLSINDVSVATKINPRILKALEEGNRSGLPPNSFARGFIRSYAAYLKIDSQPILDAYNLNEIPSNPNINTNASTASKNDEGETPAKRRTSLSRSPLASKAILIGGLLVVIFLVIGVKKVVDKYAQERVIDGAIDPKISASENKETPVPVDSADGGESSVTPDDQHSQSENAVATSANTAPLSEAKTPEVKIAETKAPAIAEIKHTETPPPVQKSIENPPAVSKPAETKLAETKPVEAKAPDLKAVPKPATPIEKPALSPTPQEVILEALDTVEVTAVIDGEAPKKIMLKPEAVHTIKAKSSVVLNIKDGGMVNLIHNGRDRGVPGDLGQPTQVKFP